MHKGSNDRQAGFTLIEILVVIAVIGLLGALMAYGLLDPGTKAQIERTEKLVQTISGAVKSFKDEMGYYPPDGLDAPFEAVLENGDTVTLRGPAVLYYHLARTWDVQSGMSESGTRGQTVEVGPFISEIKESWISADPRTASYDQIWFVDDWRRPIYYDNLIGGLSLQSDKFPDPRADNQDEFQRRELDFALWSLGKEAKDSEDDILRWKAID